MSSEGEDISRTVKDRSDGVNCAHRDGSFGASVVTTLARLFLYLSRQNVREIPAFVQHPRDLDAVLSGPEEDHVRPNDHRPQGCQQLAAVPRKQRVLPDRAPHPVDFSQQIISDVG